MGLTLLHVGCGTAEMPGQYAGYRETRLDCDPAAEPDVLASAAAMPMLAGESFDAVYACHVLEHLYAHEAAMALAEFHRVLKPGGRLELWVPDLQAIGGKIALGQLEVPLYLSAVGPISPADMIYGHRASVAAGSQAMAHRTGFTTGTLHDALLRAGFRTAVVVRESGRGSPELLAVATKGVIDAEARRAFEAGDAGEAGEEAAAVVGGPAESAGA